MRSALSPDGAYVLSGSETGELVLWHVARQAAVQYLDGPKLKLGAAIPDVVWSREHHLLALGAYHAPGAPLLVYLHDTKTSGAPKPVAIADAAEQLRPGQLGQDMQVWRENWIANTAGGSVIDAATKRAMKEQALAKAMSEGQLQQELRSDVRPLAGAQLALPPVQAMPQISSGPLGMAGPQISSGPLGMAGGPLGLGPPRSDAPPPR